MANTKKPIQIVHLFVTLALMFLFRLIPAPAPLTSYGMAVLGIFIGLIYAWTTTDRGLSWGAFAALIALGTTDFGNCSKVMASVFASDTAALLVISMLLMGPMMESGCGEYLITKLLTSKFCYKKPWNFTIIMVVGLGILSYLVNPFIIAIFMLTLFNDLFKKAGYQRGDKYPTMLIIGMFLGFLIMMSIFPWRGWGLYATAAFAKSSGGYMIDYGKYVIISVTFYLTTMFGYVLLMKVLKCDVEPIRDIDLSDLKEKYNSTSLTKHQKGILAIFLSAAIGCVFVSFAGGSEGARLIIKNIGVYGVMFIILGVALFLHVDGKPLFDIKICAKYVQWEMILSICSALCIAGALTSQESGVSAFAAQIAAPILSGKSEIVFLVLLAVLTLILTNISNNNAVLFTFMAIAGSFYSNGLITNAPAALFIITFASALGFYTPAASGFGAMIHSSECVTSASVYKYGFIILLYLIFMFTIIVIPMCQFLF